MALKNFLYSLRTFKKKQNTAVKVWPADAHTHDTPLLKMKIGETNKFISASLDVVKQLKPTGTVNFKSEKKKLRDAK